MITFETGNLLAHIPSYNEELINITNGNFAYNRRLGTDHYWFFW
jgi:hypothetical protein